MQWCVADGAVRADVPADAAAHGEPDDRAGSRADVRVSVDNLTRARLRQSRRRRSDARAPVARLKRLFLQVRADGRAHALAVGCAHLEAQLHPDFCAFGAAEPAALVEADVRTDPDPDATTLCQADRVERAPLNIVCLVSPPYPPHPPLP